jgi:hypothetical protein
MKLAESPPMLAVMVAVWAVVTLATVALNVVLMEPPLMVTRFGTATAGLLLESAT